jgi:integrase
MKDLKMARNEAELVGVHRLIQQVLETFVRERVNKSGVTSFLTVRRRCESVHSSFRDLASLGFGVEKPENLKEKHVMSLVGHWDRREQANSTIANKLSHLRIFMTKVGKPGLIKNLTHYFPYRPERHHVTQVLEGDPRLEAKGVDAEGLFRCADFLDDRLGAMLRLELYFGLRREEVLCFKPSKFVDTENSCLRLTRFAGTKGGRPRTIYFTEDKSDLGRKLLQNQILTLELVKKICADSEEGALGWFAGRERGLQKSRRRYCYLMEKLGMTKKRRRITGHGLRKAYAVDALIQRGVVPTVVAVVDPIDRSHRDRAVVEVMEDLGHSNAHTGSAYYGKSIPVKAATSD